MEIAAPARILFQIFRQMSGKKNVAGVTAIHHPMRDVDARAGKIGLFVQITDFIDRSAVDAHPHMKLRMILKHLADLNRAHHRCFRIGTKN